MKLGYILQAPCRRRWPGAPGVSQSVSMILNLQHGVDSSAVKHTSHLLSDGFCPYSRSTVQSLLQSQHVTRPFLIQVTSQCIYRFEGYLAFCFSMSSGSVRRLRYTATATRLSGYATHPSITNQSYIVPLCSKSNLYTRAVLLRTCRPFAPPHSARRILSPSPRRVPAAALVPPAVA